MTKYKGKIDVTIPVPEKMKATLGPDVEHIDVTVDVTAWNYPQTYYEPEDSGVELGDITFNGDLNWCDLEEMMTEAELDALHEEAYEISMERQSQEKYADYDYEPTYYEDFSDE
jgi:hypothetical protein